eukprot:SAG22_NODE_3277_length_1810_cov_2.159556_1_plen_128_part_00
MTSKCEATPCKGVLPHFCLACGVPLFMLAGLVCVAMQDMSHFDGVDAHFGFVFYVACAAVLCACCAWGGVAFAFAQRASEGAVQSEAVKHAAANIEHARQAVIPPARTRRALPPPAAAGGGGPTTAP